MQWAVLAATPFFSDTGCNLRAGSGQLWIFFKNPKFQRFSDSGPQPSQARFPQMGIECAFLAGVAPSLRNPVLSTFTWETSQYHPRDRDRSRQGDRRFYPRHPVRQSRQQNACTDWEH